MGLDVGTSSLKACLVRVEGGVACEERSCGVAYDWDGRPSRDPKRWLQAAHEALDGLGLSGEVPAEAVGFAGHMHSLVLLDAADDPVLPAMLWLDYQGEDQLRAFLGEHPEIDVLRATGNIALPDFTLAKWLYVREKHPAAVSTARVLTSARDYVRRQLCGGPHLTDVNEAAATQLYDPFGCHWVQDILEAAVLPEELLPRVVGPSATSSEGDAGGTVPWQMAVVGSGDQAAAARAVGATEAGVVSLSLGTSGVVACRYDLEELPQVWNEGFHLFPLQMGGIFQVIGTVPSLGPTLRWLARLTGTSISDISDLASSAGDGHSELCFFPYLGGRGAPNPDAHLKGALVGLTDETSPAEVARAVHVGIALELATVVEEMASLGVRVDNVVCSGGGASDQFLLECIADALPLPCFVAAGSSTSSSGAALLAYDALAPGNGARLEAREVVAPGRGLQEDHWYERRQSFLAGGSTGGH